MSITITINDINNLNDMERALLRLVADNHQTVATGVASTKQFIESVADKLTPFDAPIDPPEVLSPHVQVVEPATPAANPFAVAPTPASAELDAQGFPWDKRIHSSSRAKVANGNWRYARNLEGSVILAVEAELRAVQNAPSAVISIDGGGAQDMSSVAPTPVVVAAPAPSVPLPPMPTVPVVPVPPAPPAPTGDVTTFAQLMQRITPHIVSTKLSQAHIQATCASLGLPHLAALGARPDLIPAALVALESGVTA